MYSWHCELVLRNVDWLRGLRGSMGGRKAMCSTRMCSESWKWGQVTIDNLLQSWAVNGELILKVRRKSEDLRPIDLFFWQALLKNFLGMPLALGAGKIG